MKILFTTFSYYPETNGVSIVVQYLAEALAKNGHSVSVVSRMNGNDLVAIETINNVKIFRFNIGQDLFKRNIGNIEDYVSFVKNFEKDVIVLECLQCHTTDILLPFLHEMNCKVVLHSHGGPGISMKMFGWEGDILHSVGHIHNWFRWKKYYNTVLLKAAENIDACVCLSLCASDLAYLKKYFKKVFIIENAAKSIFFNESLYLKDIKNILNIRSKEYMLCIANYIANKSQLDIVKAFSTIKNKDCALVLIGSNKNKYYEKIVKLAEIVEKKTGKEIKILYNINNQYFPAILHQAKMFVMASKHEEYPVSLVEAMATGIPFVSTSAGCSRILPGGVSVENRKSLGLYMDVVESDSKMLKRLGQQGKQYAVNNNTIKEVVNNFEKVLLSLYQ